MRKLTMRDLLATLIAAAVVVPFVRYSVRGRCRSCKTRGMAGVGIVGGLLAFAIFGCKAFGRGVFESVMVALGVFTLGFGIAALIAETMWALLVPMVAGLVIIWVLTIVHDAGYLAPGHATRHA